MSRTVGKLRPSQLIQYHAPGAIVDLIEDSVMITAADEWKIPYANRMHEQRLEGYLGLSHLRLINDQEDKIKVTATPFPKWRICPSCGMMDPYARKTCFYCEKEKKEVKLYPARFVTVCEKGHISDFPWIEWVHEGKKCSSDKPVLRYESRGNAGSLSDILVTCVKCRKSKTLGQIMKKEELKKILPKCTGERPWLGDRVECNEDMQTSIRSSSNIYSPSIASALSIPLQEGMQDELQVKVESLRDGITNLMNSLPNGDILKQAICGMLSIPLQQYERVMRFYHREGETFTYDSIRTQEWGTFLQKNVDDRYKTGFLSKEVPIPNELNDYFQSIVRIDKLREIRVLKGFTRLDYPDPFAEVEHEVLPIMKYKQDWLPAINVHGEGIFFEFNYAKVLEWENISTVKEEAAKIFAKYNRQREQLGYQPRALLPRHLLIHSFSHMMMKEFAAHSGYATTSLRERIYCSDEMMGVLIYTASSDSEGSLGGLIELTRPGKLVPIFLRALEKMEYCSSDPHCADGDFRLQTSINGAACHSCSYVSETSCEWNNQLLDRRMLTPIIGYEDLAYFRI
ncbi:DrmB family protein [Neobacillus sp. SAB-20_R2A]|uniref:DrmB family protein n=1 Tax=Neobacillus sp. SAB-20_R2A TaxID=3120519 RepID=UPI003C6DF3D7